MQTPIVTQPKKYTREQFRETAQIPTAKGGVETFANQLQWMIFKPQAHAVVPFDTYQPSRAENTQRSTGSVERQ